MTSPIRVLLVDDQELIRVGFRLILEAEPDIAVVGDADNGATAAAEAYRLRPDVILMDVRMPVRDGVEATAEIVRALPETRVLVLTTFDLDEYAFGALDAGASGFLLKDVDRAGLVSAVRAVARGDAVLSPRVTREVIARRAPAKREVQPALVAALTSRELDVLREIGHGLTNTEIAAALFLGESTVKTHVGRLFAKLGARDRVQAAIIAHRAGIVSDDHH